MKGAVLFFIIFVIASATADFYAEPNRIDGNHEKITLSEGGSFWTNKKSTISDVKVVELSDRQYADLQRGPHYGKAENTFNQHYAAALRKHIQQHGTTPPADLMEDRERMKSAAKAKISSLARSMKVESTITELLADAVKNISKASLTVGICVQVDIPVRGWPVIVSLGASAQVNYDMSNSCFSMKLGLYASVFVGFKFWGMSFGINFNIAASVSVANATPKDANTPKSQLPKGWDVEKCLEKNPFNLLSEFARHVVHNGMQSVDVAKKLAEAKDKIKASDGYTKLQGIHSMDDGSSKKKNLGKFQEFAGLTFMQMMPKFKKYGKQFNQAFSSWNPKYYDSKTQAFLKQTDGKYLEYLTVYTDKMKTGTSDPISKILHSEADARVTYFRALFKIDNPQMSKPAFWENVAASIVQTAARGIKDLQSIVTNYLVQQPSIQDNECSAYSGDESQFYEYSGAAKKLAGDTSNEPDWWGAPFGKGANPWLLGDFASPLYTSDGTNHFATQDYYLTTNKNLFTKVYKKLKSNVYDTDDDDWNTKFQPALVCELAKYKVASNNDVCTRCGTLQSIQTYGLRDGTSAKHFMVTDMFHHSFPTLTKDIFKLVDTLEKLTKDTLEKKRKGEEMAFKTDIEKFIKPIEDFFNSFNSESSHKMYDDYFKAWSSTSMSDIYSKVINNKFTGSALASRSKEFLEKMLAAKVHGPPIDFNGSLAMSIESDLAGFCTPSTASVLITIQGSCDGSNYKEISSSGIDVSFRLHLSDMAFTINRSTKKCEAKIRGKYRQSKQDSDGNCTSVEAKTKEEKEVKASYSFTFMKYIVDIQVEDLFKSNPFSRIKTVIQDLMKDASKDGPKGGFDLKKIGAGIDRNDLLGAINFSRYMLSPQVSSGIGSPDLLGTVGSLFLFGKSVIKGWKELTTANKGFSSGGSVIDDNWENLEKNPSKTKVSFASHLTFTTGGSLFPTDAAWKEESKLKNGRKIYARPVQADLQLSARLDFEVNLAGTITVKPTVWFDCNWSVADFFAKLYNRSAKDDMWKGNYYVLNADNTGSGAKQAGLSFAEVNATADDVDLESEIELVEEDTLTNFEDEARY